MKNLNTLIKLIFLFMLIININKGYAQNFYKDFVKYQDARTKPREHVSKSKLHSIHEQFASEYKKLFKEVKLRTGFDMLNCDTLFIFTSQENLYLGDYSSLIWNGYHSCYYKNLHFSPFYKNEKKSIIMETDAREKLSALGPVLKRIIQRADTAEFRKYIYSPEAPPLGAGVQFLVVTRFEKHWHFASSRTFGFQTVIGK